MEMMWEAIVVGLGAHGSAAAYRLATRGHRVLGFDRFARGHTLASFGGLSRIIRLSYYEHPSYVPLLKRAWELWRELERDSGETLLTQTGGLYMGPPDGELVSGSLASARTHGLAHERVDPDTVDREPSAKDEERVRAWLRRRMPLADGERRRAQVCLYTNSPDSHFIIDRDGPVTYASACSGHGFKFASAVGELLADMTVAGASAPAFFAAGRLSA